MVPIDGHRRVAGHRDRHGGRRCQPARGPRGRDGHPVRRVARAVWWSAAGSAFKAAFSGVSNAVLPAERFDTPLTYEDFAARGIGARRGRLRRLRRLGQHDSGRSRALALPRRRVVWSVPAVQAGLAGDHRPSRRRSATGEPVTRSSANSTPVSRSVTDANRCYLGTEEQIVVSSVLREFPDDVAAFLEAQPASARDVHVPLIKDIPADGTVEYVVVVTARWVIFPIVYVVPRAATDPAVLQQHAGHRAVEVARTPTEHRRRLRPARSPDRRPRSATSGRRRGRSIATSRRRSARRPGRRCVARRGSGARGDDPTATRARRAG